MMNDNQPISQSANQPISQSANQPISQSANQPISQSANQPTFYDSYDWSFLYRRLEMLKQVGKRGKRSRKVKFDTRYIIK